MNVAIDAERENARKRCSRAARERALDRLVKHIHESSSSQRNRPNLREDIDSGRLDSVMISIQLRNISNRPKGPRGSMVLRMRECDIEIHNTAFIGYDDGNTSRIRANGKESQFDDEQARKHFLQSGPFCKG